MSEPCACSQADSRKASGGAFHKTRRPETAGINPAARWPGVVLRTLLIVPVLAGGIALLLSGLMPAVFVAIILLLVGLSPLLLVILGIMATASIDSPEEKPVQTRPERGAAREPCTCHLDAAQELIEEICPTCHRAWEHEKVPAGSAR